jgi:hypothetical protein
MIIHIRQERGKLDVVYTYSWHFRKILLYIKVFGKEQMLKLLYCVYNHKQPALLMEKINKT